MAGKSGIERLFRWTRTRPESDAIDAAEVGTAFGMELSIEDARQRDKDAAATSDEAGEQVAKPAAPRKQR
jgi:hypothetical protein